MKYRNLIVVLWFVIIVQQVFAQKISINAKDKPLNQVLVEVRDRYALKFSFDNTELSKYNFSVNKTFKNIEQMLDFLLKDLPLQYEKTSGVYIIFPKKIEVPDNEKEKPKIYTISGKITEEKTNEFLPYTQLVINQFSVLSDQNGHFSYSSTTDSIFKIRISSLGYIVKDTIVKATSRSLKISLSPFIQMMEEITVNENLMESFYTSCNEAATIKLNHKVSKYLPGSSDNSVFNLLRLQPGILASGEQTNDIVIWGDYPGQSRIIFDGYTLFGLKNYNDQISPVNPLLVKNIQLRKAGYDASFGDCVGGIAEINGKDGSTKDFQGTLSMNNFTLNSLVEVPLFKKSSLQLAYRQTYYNLYHDGMSIFPKTINEKNPNLAGFYVYPDYKFRDFNFKYSLKSENNYFFVTFYRGNDNFSYSLDKIFKYRQINKISAEENIQTGSSFFLLHKFSDKIKSEITASYSGLNSYYNDEANTTSTVSGKITLKSSIEENTQLTESRLQVKTSIETSSHHQFELNLQFLNNSTSSDQDTFSAGYNNQEEARTYGTFGFKDIVTFKNSTLDFGVRTSYLPGIQKFFPEPRIAFQQSVGEKVRFNLAWGIYNQFLVKSSYLDNFGNYRYNWVIPDGEEIPVLSAQHWVGGISYNEKFMNLNFEVFYKTCDGLTRYLKAANTINSGLSYGNGKTIGIDLYSKFNLKKHTVWVSYTLSKSTEHFEYMLPGEYLFAPQDQRHEIKIAGILNLSPFFLSANYVYGSGFLNRPFLQKNNSNRETYSRLDISATYQFTKRKNFGETGISILNVLNTENIKINSFERIPLTQISSVKIAWPAVPFTPSVFIKLYF
ncbi:MAG: hypothetical protein U0W24_19625 [Bacteroidales bacterium]